IRPQGLHLLREIVAMQGRPFAGTRSDVTGYTVNSRPPMVFSTVLHVLIWPLSWRPAYLANCSGRRRPPPAGSCLPLSAFSRSTMLCARLERLAKPITHPSLRLRLPHPRGRSSSSACRGTELRHASHRSSRARLTNIKPVYHYSSCRQWPMPLLRVR